MGSKRSSLVIAGVLTLALSVTAGLGFGGGAEAKKKGKKSVTATVSAANVAVPDRSPGANAQFGQVDIPLTIAGKKFKKKIVAADSVSVAIRGTSSAAGGLADLRFFLINPLGR